MQHLLAADYRDMPWANGRGTTKEIIRVPDTDAWQWRLSLATVADNGPFSDLPGVDRALVVATGAGMVLTVDGVEVAVPTHGAIRFSGDARVTCCLLDGPIRDLNLLARRESESAISSERLRDRSEERANEMGGPNLSVVVIERGEPVVLTLEAELTPVTVLSGSVTLTINAGMVPQMVLAHDLDTVLLSRGETVTLSSPRGAVIATGRT